MAPLKELLAYVSGQAAAETIPGTAHANCG
jgi:hypothetical protein